MKTQTNGHTELFTIGHSNHEWPEFVALLHQHSITAIADVRSSPYSKFNPQYNQNVLVQTLNDEGVQYVFMGRELGARRHESECYVGRQASYEKIAQSPLFMDGVERLLKGAKEHRIALMCSEKDPITCHRMVLVCKAIRTFGLQITHVLDDGRLETNAEAEQRLLAASGLPETDLFRSRDELIAEAYQKQAERIAWVEPEESSMDRLARLG